MSQNLIEFLKVLTIVVTWSTLILVGRRAMLSIDEDEEEEEEDPEIPNEKNLENRNVIKIPTGQDSDMMDYDGMGNYGRFPKNVERK